MFAAAARREPSNHASNRTIEASRLMHPLHGLTIMAPLLMIIATAAAAGGAHVPAAGPDSAVPMILQTPPGGSNKTSLWLLPHT